jgi:hypothetical protein
MKKISLKFGVLAVASSMTLSSLWSQEWSQESLVKVNGVVTGFSGLKVDNIVDGAVVLPSLSTEDLFQFQVDQFMGPPEKMSVAGIFSAEVPSNFHFPKQSEKYGFFPVSFGKDHFSIYAAKGSKNELIAAWFQLPWDKMLEMDSNKAPPTDMLPLLKFKKFAVAEERDWSVASNISLNLDRGAGSSVSYSWERSALQGKDMDALFLFQGTKSDRWAFANLLGKPATSGTVAGISGLEEKFKMLFMRTHVTDQDVTAAEGWIRSAQSSERVMVQSLPPALEATLVNPETVTWTPIEAPGWISFVIAANAPKPSIFRIDGIFGGAFARTAEQKQIWLDPRSGTTQTGLNENTLKDVSVMLAFIGTNEEVAMPEAGADNSAFINAASEIRMKKLK